MKLYLKSGGVFVSGMYFDTFFSENQLRDAQGKRVWSIVGRCVLVWVFAVVFVWIYSGKS